MMAFRWSSYWCVSFVEAPARWGREGVGLQEEVSLLLSGVWEGIRVSAFETSNERANATAILD
jgi:hypothetical protein